MNNDNNELLRDFKSGSFIPECFSNEEVFNWVKEGKITTQEFSRHIRDIRNSMRVEQHLDLLCLEQEHD